jgi:hypothetical protein
LIESSISEDLMRHRLLRIVPLLLALAGCDTDSTQVDGATGDQSVVDLFGADLAGVDATVLDLASSDLASSDMAGCPVTKPTPFTACTNSPGTVTGPTCVYPSGTCTCADASWTC